MAHTNREQKKLVINEEIALFLRGLIIGKVLTILVISGLFWWLVKPSLWVNSNINASSSQSLKSASIDTSAFATVEKIPVGSFKYGGSTAWASIRQLVDSQIQNIRPELQLRYIEPTNSSPGSGSGIRMLLDGQLDFVQSSRPLTPQEHIIAKERGFLLEQRPVGIDGVAVVVNPSLNVSGVTIDQLQQIYLGKITNWKVLGGPDLPITPFAQHPQDADTIIFPSHENLKNQAFSSQVQYVYSTTQALRQISKTPGGLYYASARTVVPQCSVKALPLGHTSAQLIPPYSEPKVPTQECPGKRNQVNTEAIKNGSYPLTTNLFVIIKHNNGREQQAGEAYARILLTNQGQKAIEQAGFIRVQ